ncbi:hypothetical protein HXX76_003708 [Chlamydomonas incerta]|uniref:TRP C-terminal domain-containing protein n=1 Tax=Chlamydomonas incerta TaxID=51695 RepID=A0A835TI81_CHLIN|nr:hypothetical protein HXX76_003708 [Chlamydomonas incerta]|eukprot:KAG2440854.1 hypothetical protein HXX76_003708 [Chlamydomonas incerta]
MQQQEEADAAAADGIASTTAADAPDAAEAQEEDIKINIIVKGPSHTLSTGPAAARIASPTHQQSPTAAASFACLPNDLPSSDDVARKPQALEGLSTPFARRLPFLSSASSNKPPPVSGLSSADQSLSLAQQLGIVLVVSVFVLFPNWTQAALSVFSCYLIDSGSEVDPDLQGLEFAQTRNMNQECYSGVHLAFYVPIAIIFLVVFCVGPPLTNFVLLFRVRHALDDRHTRQAYGFMYSQYRRDYYWWDSVVMLQTIALVAVDVFGGTLAVQWQSLMLLAVLVAISVINILCHAITVELLRNLEFLSHATLVLTISLNLYFVTSTGEALVMTAGGTAIAVLVLVLNLALIAAFLVLMGKAYFRDVQEKHGDKLRSLKRHVSGLVSRASRASRASSRRSDHAGKDGMLDGAAGVNFEGGSEIGDGGSDSGRDPGQVGGQVGGSGNGNGAGEPSSPKAGTTMAAVVLDSPAADTPSPLHHRHVVRRPSASEVAMSMSDT